MALQTKTYPGSTSDSSRWTWKIEAIEESANVSTKKSKITVKSYIGRPSNQTDSYFQGSANLKFVAGSKTHAETYKATSRVNVPAGGWVLIGSHTFDEVDNTGTDTSPTKITVSGSMSTSDFNPNTASATGTMTLTVLHIAPVLNISSVAENNSNLSGVDNATFVTNLSKKTFTVGYTLYDDATASSLKIYDKNGNELKSTSSIDASSGTITVDFSSITLPDNTITNNKTTFIIKIIDSLGGETSITTPEYTVIPYQLPNLVVTSSNVKRNGQLTGKGLLNLIGTFYNATIGSITNVITLSFAYWKAGETESTTYYTIPSEANTDSGNNISISNWNIAKDESEITDLDKSYAYKFKIKAIDTFGNSSTIELICNKGEYIMCEFKDRVDFKKITENGKNVVLKPIILYENETGSNNSISLNDDVSNYEYVEIYYRNNGKSYNSIKIYRANNKAAKLTMEYIYASGNFVYTENLFKSIYIESNIIEVENYGYSQTIDKEINNVNTTDNYIYITRVVGYK